MLPVAPRDNPPTIAESSGLSQPSLCCPRAKADFGFNLPEGSLVETQLEKKTPRITNRLARSNAQDFHPIIKNLEVYN